VPDLNLTEDQLQLHHPYGLAKALGITHDELADEIVRLGLHRGMRIPDFGEEIKAAVERAEGKP